MSTGDVAPPGHHHAQGDPPGTVRYWDGTQWVGDPIPAPPGHRTPTAVPDARYAGVGIRIGAACIDGMIAMVVTFVVLWDDLRLAFEDPEAYNRENSFLDQQFDAGTLSLGAIWTLVIVLMIALLGGTPGKLMVGIRITRSDAVTSPPGFAAAFKRIIPNLVAMIPFVGMLVSLGVSVASLVWVSNDPERRSVYDRVADTRVVHKHYVNRPPFSSRTA